MNIRHLTGRIDPSVARKQQDPQVQNRTTKQGETFDQVLQRIAGDKNRLQFSGHAVKRLEDRSIQLQEQDVKRLEEAVERARTKGSKESLVIDGEHAYVVNVQNRTVITAVDQVELRDKVFTKIDSAVLTVQGNGQDQASETEDAATESG